MRFYIQDNSYFIVAPLILLLALWHAFSIKPIGINRYGKRDFWDDGSFITTKWLVILYLPIIPLKTIRVTAYNCVDFFDEHIEPVNLDFKQIINVYIYAYAYCGIVVLSFILYGPKLENMTLFNSLFFWILVLAYILIPYLLRKRRKNKIQLKTQFIPSYVGWWTIDLTQLMSHQESALVRKHVNKSKTKDPGILLFGMVLSIVFSVFFVLPFDTNIYDLIATLLFGLSLSFIINISLIGCEISKTHANKIILRAMEIDSGARPPDRWYNSRW